MIIDNFSKMLKKTKKKNIFKYVYFLYLIVEMQKVYYL